MFVCVSVCVLYACAHGLHAVKKMDVVCGCNTLMKCALCVFLQLTSGNCVDQWRWKISDLISLIYYMLLYIIIIHALLCKQDFTAVFG